MSRKRAILVTGAGGEIGHGLIHALKAQDPDVQIVALDLNALPPELSSRCEETVEGNILDGEILSRIATRYEIHEVFHLAALLSTRGEFDPTLAHEVNVNGTLKLLEIAIQEARSHGSPVRFLFPSSIAVYGLESPATRESLEPVREDQFLNPATMYGCNKLYCEHLGRYFARHYQRLAAEAPQGLIDFRSIRFPGLMSAFTVPSGGTSDYAPEMIHAAAQGKPYACFVPAETSLPFMAMPDAVEAMLKLMRAPRDALSRCVYNISAFAPTAGEFADLTREAFPNTKIGFSTDPQRHGIVASWPAKVDDAAARRDWGFDPRFELRACFEDYLLPNVRQRYS